MNQNAPIVHTEPESRSDFLLIQEMVTNGARVLDVGCEDGALLKLLERTRGVDGRGIELSQAGVNRSVAQGLSVIQGDADQDLGYYPDDAFDFVILSQTIQATRKPLDVVKHLLRIGRRAIVSFPNFGYWRCRFQLLATGRMPMTQRLPQPWYATPNHHFCTIRDFIELCEALDVKVERAVAFNGSGRRMPETTPLWVTNLWGEQAVFLITR